MWVIMQVLSNPTTILKKSQTYTVFFHFSVILSTSRHSFQFSSFQPTSAVSWRGKPGCLYPPQERPNSTARAFEARVKALSLGRYKAVCCLLEYFRLCAVFKGERVYGWRVTFDRRNMFCLGKQSITITKGKRSPRQIILFNTLPKEFQQLNLKHTSKRLIFHPIIKSYNKLGTSFQKKKKKNGTCEFATIIT